MQTDRSSSLAGQVYAQILELIVEGELAPGTRIVERDLAQRLEVSRTPVREALRRLLQDGLVVENAASQYARPMVAELTAQDGRELYDIVARLEAMVGRAAAELPPERRASLVRAMTDANQAYRSAASDPSSDPREVVALDHRFHAVYVEAVAGPRLLAMRRTVKPQLSRYARRFARDLSGEILRSAAEHDEIIRAIDSGDPEAAEAAVLMNWRQAWGRLELMLRSVDDEPPEA